MLNFGYETFTGKVNITFKFQGHFPLSEWNCRSLRNKKIWLHQPPFSTADFWIFQETFFKEDDNLSHPTIIFFRTHRSNRLGGGLLIGIPKNISGRVIYSIENDPNLEVLAVEIQSKNLNFIIINIYAPHSFNIVSIKRFLDSLSVPSFMFGDFNLHHPFWGGNSQSSLSENFVDWLNNSDFSMLNISAPTHISNPHTSSIVDLTLCSASIYNEIDCYVFDCTFKSDHIPIVISWSKFQNTTRSIKTINWKAIITKSIEIFNTTSQPNIDLITDQISRTISAHTSNKILFDKDYPPWWNAACHNFSHLKKLAWNKARRSIATTEWIKYKKYRSKFKFHFKKAKENYWDSISQISRNPRMFFKILNKLSSHTNPNVKNHEIIYHNNRYVTNPITQSNLFANHFSSYSHEVQPIPLDYTTENEFLNRNIEFWELKKAISKTKNSTPGAENIPSIWLKNLDDASHLKILGMLQQQLDFSVFPIVWKHTIIIPIPKPNKDKTKLISYRPIALTSVFCKIFERILAHRITHFLTSQKKLNPNQHGFLSFRDNHTAIYKIYSAISAARKNKKFFVAVSLDIKIAYDSVHVDDLILKCLQLDSSSALSSLKNISFHSPKVIQRLAAKIHIRKNLNQNIAFLWIPGHSGVSWNEKADSISKQVSDFSPYIDWIASENIFSHLKKQSFQITEENYHKSKYQLLIGNLSDILTISKWTGNRVQDRLIARIISKTITTPDLLYRFNLHPDPLCRVCNEINDISHILLKCQKYASVRVILRRKLNIVSANITYDVLLSHVLANKNQLLIFVQTLKHFDID
ncbi:hypothetical protein AVEN_16344-1 [Araneus ventricosus]|uniref:Uncharacterized protein n=1 Tax=Araneus ventricosus TaxID=182803 RepID=A0A4Y2GQV1_ARAVE|nr:hypothetical protein AVEN_16344-1 [Araneus ventricosus]